MIDRRQPYSRYLLGIIVLLFLAGVAWWWSIRALRVNASTTPTPATTPAGPPPAASAPR